MSKKAKKSVPKILPVGLAMGVLFSGISLSGPLTEHKVHADVGTAGTVIKTFGSVYDAFLREPLARWLELLDVQNGANSAYENIAYKAPTFQRGEFGISVFDYYKNQNFSKRIKLLHPGGQIEYKTIKHGEQLSIKQAGTIVDLNPDEPELSKHDLLYITQQQLDEGKTGISLTNFGTYYLQSDDRGRRNRLGDKFLQQTFPNAYLRSGLPDVRVNENELFEQLPEDKRILGTITAEPVGKEVLSNYVMNNNAARADFNNRAAQIVTAGAAHTLNATIDMGYSSTRENWKIIPYEAGTNKVLVKTNNGYFTGRCMMDTSTQYSESINNAKVFRLVQHTGPSNSIYFRLTDDNGDVFTRNSSNNKFIDRPYRSITDAGNVMQPVRNSHIKITNKTNNEINNWLRNSQTQPTNGGNLPEERRSRGPFELR